MATGLQVESSRRWVQAAGNTSQNDAPVNAKERIAEFELPDVLQQIEQLLPFCPWAKRYVEIAAALGSLCEWEPYYNGQPVNSPLARQVVEMIKPARGTQRDMRRRSISLQRTIGVQGLILGNSSDELCWSVAHPDNIVKSRVASETHFGYLTRPDAKPGKPGYHDLPIGRLRRHHIPDIKWPDLPTSELVNVAEFMKLYCSVLEAAMATVDQRKIASNILHVKLDEQPDSEWGHHDVDDPITGQQSDEKKILSDMYANWRKGYEEGGVPRIAPHLLWWQGDVNLLELGEILPSEIINRLDDISRRAVEGLPIPNLWLLDGTGTANHWGDAELRRELHTQSVYPELEPHDAMFSEYAFRPLMELFLASEGDDAFEGATNPELWELRSNRSLIDVKPDNSEQMIDLFKCGVVSRSALVDHLPALNHCDLVDLGEGVTEVDHLLKFLGRPTDTGDFSDPEILPEPPQQLVTAAASSLADYLA